MAGWEIFTQDWANEVFEETKKTWTSRDRDMLQGLVDYHIAKKHESQSGEQENTDEPEMYDTHNQPEQTEKPERTKGAERSKWPKGKLRRVKLKMMM
eukprot:4706844-Karenia_brevis.AAC.1